MGALTLEVLGGVGNVQLAARLTNGGAAASRRTNSSAWVVILEAGTAAAGPKSEAARAARATYGTAIMSISVTRVFLVFGSTIGKT